MAAARLRQNVRMSLEAQTHQAEPKRRKNRASKAPKAQDIHQALEEAFKANGKGNRNGKGSGSGSGNGNGKKEQKQTDEWSGNGQGETQGYWANDTQQTEQSDWAAEPQQDQPQQTGWSSVDGMSTDASGDGDAKASSGSDWDDGTQGRQSSPEPEAQGGGVEWSSSQAW